LIAELSHVMCLMVQAEAAALTAFRAELKGSSVAVVASLQAGAAELFEKAAKVVREYTGEARRVCGGGGMCFGGGVVPAGGG
jgi:methylmalonyl-CoA mutase cobalamin-binding subunit